ncbi:MAG TPA: hypothetical protein VFL47_12395 [Flavisolibacter sp.]|nr:hypothetical protein [Flavisolibacter sp.]
MRHLASLLIFTVSALAGCHSGTISPDAQQPLGDTLHTNSKAAILNQVVLHETGGLRVAKAFLANDSGHLLPAGNKTQAGQPVFLNIVIAGGWMAENNLVFPGASQIITTETGKPVLSSTDLFASSTGVPETKANYLQLKTVITNTESENQAFVVHFRIWDKKGPGEIKGNYRLQITSAEEE